MTTERSKPVVFLAFANARDDGVPYLRNLPQEARWLRLALRRAERAGLCQLVERNNATLEDILDVFQDPEYRNRIAVFHYGGHANGYQLLTETTPGTQGAFVNQAEPASRPVSAFCQTTASSLLKPPG